MEPGSGEELPWALWVTSEFAYLTQGVLPQKVLKIVSGGQTGADRTALDFAIEHGLEHGGWCPRDRLAEDGVIPGKYQLRETSTTAYHERTEYNVRQSDGTLAGGWWDAMNVAKTALDKARQRAAGGLGSRFSEFL